MTVAILVNDVKTGHLVKSSLFPIDAEIYTETANIEEQLVLFVPYQLSDKDIKTAVEQLKEKGKHIFCIIQDHERAKWGSYLEKKKVPFSVNGVDSADAIQKFVGGQDAGQEHKTIVFISSTGGAGKSLLSSYLAKKISDVRKVHLVDWNYLSPSIYHYFNLSQKDADAVQVLKLIRSGMPYDLSVSEAKIGKNLTLSLMSLDYFESTKWRAEDFILLWDHFEQKNNDAVIFEVPNHPFSITSAIALMRGTDIVIPLLAEQNSIGHTLMLLKWLKIHRERNMPRIHLILNRFDQETNPMTIQDLQKTLGHEVVIAIPNIKDVWAKFVQGEMFKDNVSKELFKMTEPLNKFIESLGFEVTGSNAKKETSGLIHKLFSQAKAKAKAVKEVRQNGSRSIR
ncbi:hypothetical protein [Ferviditalea candida]|uniref:CobQ/CobB/MinD/ParA nucleotide binding domain-containing protein n=1 Tax=Ferviditalea candida TaxID=3108399 RepID=A0ABU5ZN94_9BACL|nr:hypothetical protein [Paenibacillaceae bacterium T2]